MIQTARRRDTGTMPRRLAGWLARLQSQLSDRLFADQDAFARQHGWQITKTTGRFGFGGRAYHDPRFGQRAVVIRDREGTAGRQDAAG